MTTPDHTLTDAEREALEDACVGNGEYLCCHRTTHRKTGKPVGGEMLDAVEAIIAARLAAVEAVRDHYIVLAGLPVHSADVADRLDAALGSNADD